MQVLTAWDGHVRIDVDPGLLRLTMLTIEPTTESQLRSGLSASFVSADPHGPPAALRIELQDGRVPGDVAVLLGARLRAVVDAALDVAPGQDFGWVRLNLAELDELAAAWAPYRVRVLAAATGPDPQARSVSWRAAVGSWAGELWTSLGGPDLKAALDRLGSTLGGGGREPGLVYRGGPASRGGPPSTRSASDRGTWTIPPELAAAGGVEPEMIWSARAGDEAVTLVVWARRTDSPPTVQLHVGWDDGSGEGVSLAPDAIGGRSAELTRTAGAADVDAADVDAVRLWTVPVAGETRR